MPFFVPGRHVSGFSFSDDQKSSGPPHGKTGAYSF
jgi:hypothetical protein